MTFKANLVQRLQGFGRAMGDEWRTFSPRMKMGIGAAGLGLTGFAGYSMMPGPRARRRQAGEFSRARALQAVRERDSSRAITVSPTNPNSGAPTYRVYPYAR